MMPGYIKKSFFPMIKEKVIVCFNYNRNNAVLNIPLLVKPHAKLDKSIVGVWQPKGTKHESTYVPMRDTSEFIKI